MQSFMTFAYPPTYFLQLYPLGLLSTQWHFLLYTAVSLCLAGWASYKLAHKKWLAATLWYVEYHVGTIFTIFLGQNSIFNASLLALSIIYLPTFSFTAGIIASLASYKMQTVLPFVGFFVIQKHIKTLAGFATGVAVQVLLSVLFFGITPWIEYWQNINTSQWLIEFYQCHKANFSANAALCALGVAKQWLWLLQYCISALVISISGWALYKSKNLALSASILFFGTCIYSPYFLWSDTVLFSFGTVFFCIYNCYSWQKWSKAALIIINILVYMIIMFIRTLPMLKPVGYGAMVLMWAICVFYAFKNKILTHPIPQQTKPLSQSHIVILCILIMVLGGIIFQSLNHLSASDFAIYRIVSQWLQTEDYANIYNKETLTNAWQAQNTLE